MDRIVFLGTSRCLPTKQRDNSSIVFETDREAFLVDCSGKPYQKLLQSGIDPDKLSAVFITHSHVDHCYGIGSLLSSLHLSGRRRPLSVIALSPVMAVVHGLLELFGYPDSWAKVMPLYPIEFREVDDSFGTAIHESEEFSVRGCRNGHVIPNLSSRITFKTHGKEVVYTSDTSAPHEAVVRLATGADTLIHEVNFLAGDEAFAKRDGHSTVGQAGEVARRAGVRRLVLIHHGVDGDEPVSRMKSEVGGGDFEVLVPQDMDVLTL